MTRVAPDRLLLFAAVLALLGGYLAVFRPYEAAIAQRYVQLDDGRVLLDGRPERARRDRVVEAEEHALALRLAASGILADPTVSVGHFVSVLAHTARSDDIGVTQIAIDGSELRFAMHGTYRQQIRFVRDLAASGVAARIGVETMDDGRATARVTLLRVPQPLADGSDGTL